jgi:hypothetical protein
MIVSINLFPIGDQPSKLMPYGQNERGNCFSIVINALWAKEKTKFKQFLNKLVALTRLQKQ